MCITTARVLTLLTASISTAGLLLFVPPPQPLVQTAWAQDPNATLPPPPSGRRKRRRRAPTPAPAGNSNKVANTRKADNANKAAPRRNAAANSNAGILERTTLPPVNSNAVDDAGAKPAAGAARNANAGHNANADAIPIRPRVIGLDGEPVDTGQPPPRPDADLLLPEDFPKLESEEHQRRMDSMFGRKSRPAPDPNLGLVLLDLPERTPLIRTFGEFRELSGKRKVFVNVTGKAGERITERLREYGQVELVGTAREAEFAVHFFPWHSEQGKVTGGEVVITIRDPSNKVPRVVWENDDNNAGVNFRKNDAFNKLIKRFISDLKKLRGEK